MKKQETLVDKIKNLSPELKQRFESENQNLLKKSGAYIKIVDVWSDLIKVEVKNVNGMKTSKHILLSEAYRILTRNLPSDYRLSIKL
jgi:hypothetical protein